MSLAASLSQAAEEKVSRAMEKPLKEANDAMQAKKYEEAIAKAKAAQAVEGRTAYDNYVINEILGASYVRANKFAESYQALSANANSQFMDAKAKGQRYLALTQLAYTLKNYPETVEWANKAIESGQDTTEIRVLVAQTNYLQGKYKEAAAAMQEVVSRTEKGGRPTEASLQLLFQCYVKLNDQQNQGRIVEKLVTYYPKPDYWLNAMITLIQSAHNDERLLLQVYRLQTDVGTMKRSDQFGEMAQLSVEQGYPGEAVATLDQAMAKNVFTDAREKAKYERLLEAAKKALAQEKEGVAKSEQEAVRTGSGDLMVAVGASYLFNIGDANKAVTLIQQGITKGVTKIPLYDAYVTLGLAQAKAKNGAEADKSFGKVDKNDNYERLAKLWSLRVH
jgi:tetratricopeptide (TPR) repeat protein